MKVTFVVATGYNFYLDNVKFGEETLITECFNLQTPICKGKLSFDKKLDVIHCTAEIEEVYLNGIPAVGGVSEIDETVQLPDRKFCNKFEIEQIGICFGRNEDPEIKSIGYQVHNKIMGAFIH